MLASIPPFSIHLGMRSCKKINRFIEHESLNEHLAICIQCSTPGGCTSLLEAYGEVPLDGGRIFTTGLTTMGSHFQ